jgi:hypothetical protein
MLIAKSILAFFVLFIAFRQIDPSGILFYQGMATGAIVSVLPLVISWWRNNITATLVRDSVIAFLLIYAFVITVPTNADRSFSLKMLQRLAQAPSGLSRDEINKYYAIDFLDKGGLDQRLVEQQATGTVVERDGRYTLTSKGEAVNRVTLLTCRIFICNGPPGSGQPNRHP